MSDELRRRSLAAPVRVLIVDDHEALASCMAQVLDAEPDLLSVGVAGTLRRARVMVRTALPDVVLLDHRLPDGDGVAAIRELRAIRPSAKFVVLTASTGDHVLLDAMEAGASGFLSKTRGMSEVTSAVRAATAGEVVISPEMLARLLPRLSSAGAGGRGGLRDLTERERDVLALLADGLTNAAIGDRLFLSVHTVQNHIAKLSHKLGAHSKLEVLSIAFREGVLPGR
jgi:DNA-binding NarL/FixJ family response regulator